MRPREGKTTDALRRLLSGMGPGLSPRISAARGQQARTLQGHAPDYLLALGIFVLLAFGLVMIYSISPILSHKLVGSADRNFYFLNQIKYIVLGLGVWVIASQIRYDRWRQYAPLFMIGAIFATLLLFTPLRSHAYGATRWVDLGPFSFQPAEIMKIGLIFYLAMWFERRADDIESFWDGVLPFAVMVGLACFVIVVLQKDMGTMLVVAMSCLAMLWAAGVRVRHMLGLLGTGLVALWASIIAFPHRMERMSTFLDPGKDLQGTGYHVNQAMIAIGSGGLLGLGLGKSIQVYGYLPEAANDSIFAVVAEEFGFVGAMAVICLFAFVAYRGFLVARDAPDMFGRLVATGISSWLLWQAVINVGAMIGLVPLTGIPLPFISYGGTSLIISLFGAGVLVNISKFTRREAVHAGSRERRGNSRSYLANLGDARRVKASRS